VIVFLKTTLYVDGHADVQLAIIEGWKHIRGVGKTPRGAPCTSEEKPSSIYQSGPSASFVLCLGWAARSIEN
jgi:hypothetical protein